MKPLRLFFVMNHFSLIRSERFGAAAARRRLLELNPQDLGCSKYSVRR
jgi:hypothetical protein